MGRAEVCRKKKNARIQLKTRTFIESSKERIYCYYFKGKNNLIEQNKLIINKGEDSKKSGLTKTSKNIIKHLVT